MIKTFKLADFDLKATPILKGLHHDFHRKIKKVYSQKYEDLAKMKRLH
jgi:hypothetical protein